jgi:hypothetical protein
MESDIAQLKGSLREADAKEIIAAGYQSTEAALRSSFSRSIMCSSVEVEGSVVGMWGVVPDSLLGNSANVWLLGSPEMGKIKKTFVKMSRRVIATYLERFPILWNYVDVRYMATIRWLKSCGAQFSGEPIALGGTQFLGFVLRRI